MACVVRVAIADIVDKIDKPYDYICRIPADDLIGRRALVPFGNANMPKKCLIIDSFETDDVSKLKTMISLVDVVLEVTIISQPGSILAFLAFDTVPF